MKKAEKSTATMNTIYSFDYYTESWIEVSSQPSSSSLSSAATDDVITTGLRVQSNARRRRRLTRSVSSPYVGPPRSVSTTGSSQEEYEESESESDRIMNSSNEGLERHFTSPPAAPSSVSDDLASNEGGDDDDENSTTLGVTTAQPAFRPQPNAFSHPPQSATTRQARSAETQRPYFSTPRGSTPRQTANSYPNQSPRSHTPYNMISPSHAADHDAALRASLSTLLSCARALPKREQAQRSNPNPSANRIEPSTLRMIPESVVMGGTNARPTARRLSTSSSTSASPSVHDKGKRKASTSKDRREMRKKRRASGEGEMMVSPTLMTWVVSAGVVVLFSAISFSAGYAIGKEVGMMEVGAGGGGEGVICGREVGRGLRKLRLGTPTVVRV